MSDESRREVASVSCSICSIASAPQRIKEKAAERNTAQHQGDPTADLYPSNVAAFLPTEMYARLGRPKLVILQRNSRPTVNGEALGLMKMRRVCAAALHVDTRSSSEDEANVSSSEPMLRAAVYVDPSTLAALGIADGEVCAVQSHHNAPMAATIAFTVVHPVGGSASYTELMRHYVAPLFLDKQRAISVGESFALDGPCGQVNFEVLRTVPDSVPVVVGDRTKVKLPSAPLGPPQLTGPASPPQNQPIHGRQGQLRPSSGVRPSEGDRSVSPDDAGAYTNLRDVHQFARHGELAPSSTTLESLGIRNPRREREVPTRALVASVVAPAAGYTEPLANHPKYAAPMSFNRPSGDDGGVPSGPPLGLPPSAFGDGEQPASHVGPSVDESISMLRAPSHAEPLPKMGVPSPAAGPQSPASIAMTPGPNITPIPRDPHHRTETSMDGSVVVQAIPMVDGRPMWAPLSASQKDAADPLTTPSREGRRSASFPGLSPMTQRGTPAAATQGVVTSPDRPPTAEATQSAADESGGVRLFPHLFAPTSPSPKSDGHQPLQGSPSPIKSIANPTSPSALGLSSIHPSLQSPVRHDQGGPLSEAMANWEQHEASWHASCRQLLAGYSTEEEVALELINLRRASRVLCLAHQDLRDYLLYSGCAHTRRSSALLAMRLPSEVPLHALSGALERKGIRVESVWRARATGTAYATFTPNSRSVALDAMAAGRLGIKSAAVKSHVTECELISIAHTIVDDLARAREFELQRWNAIVRRLRPISEALPVLEERLVVIMIAHDAVAEHLGEPTMEELFRAGRLPAPPREVPKAPAAPKVVFRARGQESGGGESRLFVSQGSSAAAPSRARVGIEDERRAATELAMDGLREVVAGLRIAKRKSDEAGGRLAGGEQTAGVGRRGSGFGGVAAPERFPRSQLSAFPDSTATQLRVSSASTSGAAVKAESIEGRLQGAFEALHAALLAELVTSPAEEDSSTWRETEGAAAAESESASTSTAALRALTDGTQKKASAPTAKTAGDGDRTSEAQLRVLLRIFSEKYAALAEVISFFRETVPTVLGPMEEYIGRHSAPLSRYLRATRAAQDTAGDGQSFSSFSSNASNYGQLAAVEEERAAFKELMAAAETSVPRLPTTIATYASDDNAAAASSS